MAIDVNDKFFLMFFSSRKLALRIVSICAVAFRAECVYDDNDNDDAIHY